ncbi:MAG: hypothetical protein M1461_01370 [Nitrospirae bacterium]|nr:hypothetical protein [Nitrospirota bacterium]
MYLTDLFYRNGDGWVAMPYWAVSYISLGSAIAISKDSQSRLVVGLATPVRAYAAALIAMGIVIARANVPFDSIEEAEYLDYLRIIEPGKPVLYRLGANWYHGEFIGVDDRKDDGPSILLTWKKGNQRCRSELSLKEARKRLQIIGGTKDDSPERAVGRRILHNKEFLKIILDSEKTDDFAIKSRLECLIIGRVNILRHEIKETEISCGARHTNGTIQDVLRARKFLAEGSAYRSNVMPSDREAYLTADNEIPYATVFDGATSFLKWRDYRRQSNWIVLLDKTEPCFREAVDQLNQEYVERRVSDAIITSTLELPQGSEILAFQEDFE